MARLHADLRLRGLPAIASTVGPIDRPKAVLARSNAEAVRQLLHRLAAGHASALVGGSRHLQLFCQAALDLADTGRTAHPELACFASWHDVVSYVDDDEQGDELKLLVALIGDFGAATILTALHHTTSEDRADIVISTAHRSKGRESDRVALAGDYRPPKPGHDCTPDELRLLYVAATRARRRVDPTRVPTPPASLPVHQPGVTSRA